MTFAVRYTSGAREDLERIAEHSAEAPEAICKGLGFLNEYPFSCRKPLEENPFLRELLIPFGSGGYVALFEIEGSDTVTVLALRTQREDDLH